MTLDIAAISFEVKRGNIDAARDEIERIKEDGRDNI